MALGSGGTRTVTRHFDPPGSVKSAPPRPAKTIILCCNTTFGVANFRAGAIRALVAQGHRVIVVAPRDGYVDAIEALGARFEHWQLSGRSTNVLGELTSLVHLIRLYRRHRADIAFHFTIKAVLYGAIAGKLAGTPFVSVVTGLGYVFMNETPLSALAMGMYRMTLRWSKRLWLLNADDHAALLRRRLISPGLQVEILPGEGIDLTYFVLSPLPSRSNPGETILLMIARLLADKGVFELVEAARQVRARRPDVRVQILGAIDSDNPTAIPQSQIDAWCAEGVIEHLGTCRDVRPFIANADAVVLPSYREGLPRALLEACAMGRPVIATNVPGCREVVAHGDSGYLCRVRDANDLAARIDDFLALGPSQREAMGREGRRLVEERYDERYVVEKYMQVVANV